MISYTLLNLDQVLEVQMPELLLSVPILLLLVSPSELRSGIPNVMQAIAGSDSLVMTWDRP